jgi:hypothetical protein
MPDLGGNQLVIVVSQLLTSDSASVWQTSAGVFLRAAGPRKGAVSTEIATNRKYHANFV